jgi:hypothetical protein
MCGMLADRGVALDGIYVCPHTPDDGCACRKRDGLDHPGGGSAWLSLPRHSSSATKHRISNSAGGFVHLSRPHGVWRAIRTHRRDSAGPRGGGSSRGNADHRPTRAPYIGGRLDSLRVALSRQRDRSSS